MPAWVDLATDTCTSKRKTDSAPPARVSVSRRHRASLARYAAAQELDRRVVLVGRPMTLEIVKECRPVMFEAMFIKLADRERKGVVDVDQRGDNSASGAVFTWRRRRRNLDRRRIALAQ
jgi:hypothetical protein